MNYWNSLIRVSQNATKIANRKGVTQAKKSEMEYISKLAICHLHSLNTAGGVHIIRRELELFFKNYGYLNK